MSRKPEVSGSSKIFQMTINDMRINIEKKDEIKNYLCFNHFFDFLDINHDGLVFNELSLGVITPNGLMMHSIEKNSTTITTHSIVGGG